jgi:hypothetical protein
LSISPGPNSLQQEIEKVGIHKDLAERWHKRQQARVTVLRSRISWHLSQLEKTNDQATQDYHMELIEEDEGVLQDHKIIHAKRKVFYKRQGVDLPEIDYGE